MEDDRAQGWGTGIEIGGRDAEVLKSIEEEGLSAFTFDGLRRITGIHPETLSRILERLEEGGILVRSPEGYTFAAEATPRDAVRQASRTGQRVPILHTFLPLGLGAGSVVSALKGRWFDRLRWVGVSESDGELVLKWVTDDGAVVIDAEFSSGELDVQARIRSQADLPAAVRAGHQLLGRITKLYATPRQRSRMAMQIGYFRPYAM